MHQELFTKISKNPSKTKESEMSQAQDARTLETVKLLAKQIIEIRELIGEQTETISSLRREVQVLKNKQSETDSNLKLSHIDQRDIAKQLRMLKANVNGNEIASQRVAQQMQSSAQTNSVRTQEEVNPADYYSNFQNSKVVQNSQTLEMINEAMTETDISMQKVEDVAKQFIFGRMPKLLNLD